MPQNPEDSEIDNDVLMKRHPLHLKQSVGGSSVEGSPTHPIKETDESVK